MLLFLTTIICFGTKLHFIDYKRYSEVVEVPLTAETRVEHPRNKVPVCIFMKGTTAYLRTSIFSRFIRHFVLSGSSAAVLGTWGYISFERVVVFLIENQ
ncbi:hypothetical protein CEXT_597661 [Caerostris extrusa]|uniref:Secreted protein n=1 Tax=Caerostris extrusa TaxID=172846 RepID=A0AAV4RQ42_CAEEX|nr:hypothetical protein CEXT_597661 [Caerostris extrusa]